MRFLWVFLIFLTLSWAVPGMAEDQQPPEANESSQPGFFTKVLWYLPNRVMDALDIFRLRVGVGPGMEAGARITDVGSLYLGHSRTIWVGLPGERVPGDFPHFMGATQKEGLVLFGVDASDVQPNPPTYDFSEIGFQIHLGPAGVEAGIIPTEIVDFLFGLIGKDFSGDDLPRKTTPPLPESGRVLRLDHENRTFPLEPRPDHFISTHQRLDYLQTNLPIRMRGYMHSMDRAFVEDELATMEQPPVTDLEIGVWVEFLSGPNGNTNFDQSIRLDVEFPNMERNLSLFVDSDYNDELPGTDSADKQTPGFVVGFRRQLKKMKVSADAGIKSRWPPELFARVRWRPHWEWGDTNFRFEQRLFWENEDGFGVLSSFEGFRWLGEEDHWIFRNLTAGRFSESTEGFEWQQSFILGHMTHLVEENLREENLSTKHTLQCLALTTSMFGKDRHQDKYRATLLYRQPVYKEFVLVEVEPGLEWRKENDWTTQYRLDVGMVLIF